MSSISGIGVGGGAWKHPSPPQGLQTRTFARVDTDSSGGVNAEELQTMLSEVSEKTGVSFQDSAQDLLTQMDQDGDGSLNKGELGQGMQSLLPPPPSTMEFAQGRGASGQGGDLFAKIDSDGDGALSQDEFQSLAQRMPPRPGGAGDASERFSTLDSDGDGSLSQAEFEAGRPSGPPPGGPGGMAGAGPMMGPPPPRNDSASSSEESGSGSYDAADLNHDGTVSPMERLASALQEISQSSSDDSSGANLQIAQLAQSLYEQISKQWLQDGTGGSVDANA
ncbi:MAG: XopAW family type III secretion system calcium-binding effector [Rhodoferax sp.]